MNDKPTESHTDTPQELTNADQHEPRYVFRALLDSEGNEVRDERGRVVAQAVNVLAPDPAFEALPKGMRLLMLACAIPMKQPIDTVRVQLGHQSAVDDSCETKQSRD